jgi:hypothetical protein
VTKPGWNARAGLRGRREEPSSHARDPVVDRVGKSARNEPPGGGQPGPRRPDESQALEHRGRAHENAAVGGEQDDAVGEREARAIGHDGGESLATERREAQARPSVEPEKDPDGEVAQAAAPVVEEHGRVAAQGVSASSSATLASMLATGVSPSWRKRSVPEPSGPGRRMSMTSFVGNAASSYGSTSASPT